MTLLTPFEMALISCLTFVTSSSVEMERVRFCAPPKNKIVNYTILKAENM